MQSNRSWPLCQCNEQWLREVSERSAQADSDKFVMMASMNLVNCIAGAAHG